MSDINTTKRPPGCLQQAGIKNAAFTSSTLELSEISAMTIVRLHSLVDAEQLGTALTGVGFDLPPQTGQSSGQDPVVMCLRPNDYLLCSESLEAKTLIEKLQPAIDSAETALFNHSDGLATFRLSGQGAPWLLSKLSSLDFTAGISQGQHCTRTRIAHAAVVVNFHPTGGTGTSYVFDLLFDRSLAKYLWDLLTASANHADELARTYGNAA